MSTTESPRILFVDDEPGIRATLPRILELHGFQVSVASTVPEALAAIHSAEFDVLLTDLNIGEPGDGFTVVSAMRRTQPRAVTIIITGYPAFETALQAIRKQVDDYVVKPTNVEQLVFSIRTRLSSKQPHRPLQLKRVAMLLLENREEIIQHWFSMVEGDPEIAAIPMSPEERADHIPALLSRLVYMLEQQPAIVTPDALLAAAEHGRTRRRQGYSIPMIVNETRLLRRSICDMVQNHLLTVDISYIIPDLVHVGDGLDAHIKASIEAYLNEAVTPADAGAQHPRRFGT